MSESAGVGGLYHQAIVDAARRATGAGRLAHPDASVRVDNPLCGDRVSVDVVVVDARLGRIAHRVKGCVLCEAAASVLAANAVGMSAVDVAAVRNALEEALSHGFEPGALVWPDLQMFAPVAAHRSRRRCVALPFEALSAAMAGICSRGVS